MEQFNLEKWLQDKSRKICTRDERVVKILDTEFESGNGNKSVLAKCIYNNKAAVYVYTTDGKANNIGETENDLFFADEEDDEFMLNSFLHKLEVCDLLSNKEITWIKNKLKSIKNWKPTEKQLEELEYVTRGNSYPHLTSLYQDLKNL